MPLKALASALAATGLVAVGAASPAAAGAPDVLWYIENDKNYTFEATARPSLDFDAERDGDSLPSDPLGFTVTVPSGDHQYVGWGRTYQNYDVYAAEFELREVVAKTDTATYPIMPDGTGTCLRVSGRLNNFGTVETCHYGLGYYSYPDWMTARSALRNGHVDVTFTLTWDAPREQEVKLQNLKSVEPSDCTITGTNGDDVIEGTDGDDVICAGDGDDVIDGKGGNDTIVSGPGDDTVDGGAGDDVVKGGSGDDEIAGGDGDDTLGGGAGNDRVDGGSGDDAMHGATGEDILVGGEGNDLTDGGAGEDALLPDASSGAEEGDRQLRHSGLAHQADNYIHHSNTLASTDALGNFLEDGNSDGVTAQGASVSSGEEELMRWLYENCKAGRNC